MMSEKLSSTRNHTLCLEISEGRKDTVTYVGPSLWGWIFRSGEQPAYYRIIPNNEAIMERRFNAMEWMHNPRQHCIAPLVEVGQTFIHDTPYFYLRYEVEVERTWQDIINDPAMDFLSQLQYGIRLLKELPRWRQVFNNDPRLYMIPMPADIAFTTMIPYLLAMPFWGKPSVDAVFTEPLRGLYLAPEYIRGNGDKIWGDKLDFYSICMSLFQCLFSIHDTDNPGNLLLKAANGSILSKPQCKRRFPFWLTKVDVYKDLENEMRKALHPELRMRGGLDPLILAKKMEEYGKQLQPGAVINLLIDSQKSKEALALIHDILLEQDSYELLILSAKITWQALKRSWEAVDILEQAINKNADNPAAYEMQLNILFENLSHLNCTVGDASYKKIWRNYNKLSPDLKTVYEVGMARFLLYHKQFDEAARFIYSLILHPVTKEFAWWKFELWILYATVIMEQGNLDEAQNNILGIKRKLYEVEKKNSFLPEEISLYKSMITEMEREIYKRKGIIQ